MTSPSSSGRRRGLPKQMSSEDQALNMIAREAEARLAAKRAARAEARSIRMKELEKKQKEADEQMDKEYERENESDPMKRRPNTSRIKTATSSLNSSETNLNELGVSDEYVKQLKDTNREIEDKFRKAMVNSAQLDNERQAFQYQVECLKDIIEDLTENLDNITDELQIKSKDFSKLSREHEKLDEEFRKCTKLLADRERILDEHGINLDGTLREPENNDETDNALIEDRDRLLTNHLGNAIESNAERESLLSEIQSLKEEVAELRSQNEGDLTRREADHIRSGGGADLERSFVDVSDEANAIQDDDRHRGVYLNNNEKCEEFEVIDDGSQQGGIRNFEDKSFEKSTRSSLLSSVQTTVTESMESEKPLEISFDKFSSIKAHQQKEEYDIVQSYDESSPKKTVLDIDRFTANAERSQSPLPMRSNINIDKYFAINDDDNDVEVQTASTFSVDKYFAFEESTKDSDTPVEVRNGEYALETQSSEENHFETIESTEAPSHSNIKNNIEDRVSPYLDVETDSNGNISDQPDVEASYDSIEKEDTVPLSLSLSNDPLDTYTPVSIDELTPTNKDVLNEVYQDNVYDSQTKVEAVVTTENVEAKVPNSSLQCAADVSNGAVDVNIGSTSTVEPNESQITVDESISDISELNTAFSSAEDTTQDSMNITANASDITDGASLSRNTYQEESDLLRDLENSKPAIVKEGKFTTREPLTQRQSRFSTDDYRKAVRQDMENLYDQIAGESNEQNLYGPTDTTDSLPPDATFGIFAVSSEIGANPSSIEERETVFSIVGQREDSSNIVNENEDETGGECTSPIQPKKKEGLLVRVESFNAPKSEAPEIKVIKPESPKESPGETSPPPTPKERKKKKKKSKKPKLVEEKKPEENKETSEQEDSPRLSALENPGHVSDKDSNYGTPAQSPSPSKSLGDIPPQFLDISANFQGDSEASDSELGEGHDIKKKGSLKKSHKKDGCKTQ